MSRSRLALVVGVIVVALVAAGSASPATASGYRSRMLGYINRTRANRGLRELKLNLNLSHYARRHSQQMADRGYLFHTVRMARHLRGTHWTSWGENLAKARTLKRVRELWLKSPDHRFNLLNRRYDHVGIGVVAERRWLWVTAIFYG